MPSHAPYIKANWQASTTTYTLSYYVENPNDTDYTNIGTSVISNVTSGDLVSKYITNSIITSNFNKIKSDYAYFTYDEEKSLQMNNNYDVEILGNGTTIINIYYKRNYYNIVFNLNDSSYTTPGKMVFPDGSEYTSQNMYSFRAKYEQDIATLWPTAKNFQDGNFPSTTRWGFTVTYYFNAWTGGASGNSSYVSSRITLTADLIEDSTAESTTTYDAKYQTSSNTNTLRYCVESFDQETGVTSSNSDTRVLYNGVYYDIMTEYNNIVYNSSSTNWSAKSITGLTNTGKSNSGTTYYFYYSRNEYTVTFYNMNNVYKTVTMLYGQSLEEIANTVPDSYPIDVPDKENWVFDGNWYYDEKCTLPMEWKYTEGSNAGEYKTITDNITLYANWIPPIYNVSFDVNGGDWTDTDPIYVYDNNLYNIKVNSSESMISPESPTRQGYIFEGWYYENENGEEMRYLFSDSQKVYQDISLHAVWSAQNYGKYTVKYVLAEYDENGNLIEDITKYKNLTYLADDKVVTDLQYGTQIVEYAISIPHDDNMYLVSDYMKDFIVSVNDDENVVYFFYSLGKEVQYSVYYVLDTGVVYNNGDIPDDSLLLAPTKIGTLANIDEVIATESSIEIDGYEVDSYSKSQVIEVKNQDVSSTDNAIYFYYSVISKQEDYIINYYFMNSDGNYPDVPDYRVEGVDGEGKYIWATDYAKYLSLDNPLYEGHEFDEENSDVLMVISSQGVSVLNIYFKNLIYEVTYDTMGGEFTDARDIYTKVSDELYSEKVNYNSKATQPSIPLKSGFRFVGWYNKESDEIYDFNTAVKGNVELYAKWAELVEINITKIWDDNSNQDGKRPTSVTAKLMNGQTVVDTVILNEDNNWTAKFIVDKYENIDGDLINYTALEEEVLDYTLSITKDDSGNFILTNKHIPETKVISVTKVWDDDNNRDGKRPENLNVKLVLDGEELESIYLNEENNWYGEFSSVDVYKDGVTLNYDVTEEEVLEYTLKSKELVGNSYTFTNTHVPERANKIVTKIWRDGSNKDNTRPDSIKFVLLKNGEVISDEITLTAANSNGNADRWEYEFTDLYVYENGQKIIYTVKEVEVAVGYGVIYNQNKLYMYNCYPPEVQISVEKIWNDEDNADGIRPEYVFVQLYADGKPYKVGDINVGYVELSEENSWSYTWEFVEKYNENMEEYVYEVKEVDMDLVSLEAQEKYAVDISLENEENIDFQRVFQIQNSYVPQKKNISVKKTWEDNNNQDGKRPDSVTVNLLANDEIIDTVILNEQNNWEYTFENVNVNKLGVPINYSVTENEVPEYETNIEYSEEIGSFVITNTHIPETKNITITKIWNDNNNQDGKRPASVIVNLLADSEITKQLEFTSDVLQKVIYDLPVYKDGKKIVYGVEEESVDYYTTTYSGNNDTIFEITNTHEVEKIDITINKTWQDDNNRDGIRPEEVVLTLKDGDEIIQDNIVLNEKNTWKTVISSLDKYKAGNEISYTIEEDEVEKYTFTSNYNSESNTFDVINSHVPDKISLEISKKFDDTGYDYLRPNEVYVNLYANDNLIQENILLQKDKAYYISIVGLYKNENGIPIDYRIEEVPNELYTSNVNKIDNKFEVTNTIKKYKIKTSVNGVGGNITGKELEYVEEVVYGLSSKNDIVVTPDEGYKISKITINGAEQVLPENTKIAYTLPAIENIIQDQNIVVEFSRIEYKITTEVINGGGTISGENDEVYEIVLHGDSSIKDIVLTPDKYYEISKIIVNGEEQVLPDDKTISYTLDKFLNVTENIHVQVEYARRKVKLVVEYVKTDGTKIIDDVVSENLLMGNNYTTKKKDFDNYYLVKMPENYEGILEDDIVTVTYVYEYKPNIYITKIVKGDYADITKDFDFEVNITDENNNYYTEDLDYEILDENDNLLKTEKLVSGNGIINIFHNQKIIIYKVPEKLKYSITELGATDYETTINGNIVADKKVEGQVISNTYIDVINEKMYVVPTGIKHNIFPYIILIVIVLGSFVFIRNNDMTSKLKYVKKINYSKRNNNSKRVSYSKNTKYFKGKNYSKKTNYHKRRKRR